MHYYNVRSVHPISGFPEYPSGQKQRGVCWMTTHWALVPQLQGVTQRVLRHASVSEHSEVASQPTRMGVAKREGRKKRHTKKQQSVIGRNKLLARQTDKNNKGCMNYKIYFLVNMKKKFIIDGPGPMARTRTGERR